MGDGVEEVLGGEGNTMNGLREGQCARWARGGVEMAFERWIRVWWTR